MAYIGKHVKNAPVRAKKSRFGIWMVLYSAVFLAISAALLGVLWHRLDVFEASRPDTAFAEWMAVNKGGIRGKMESMGIEKSFLDTLDFDNVTYYKKLDEYTEQSPAYGIRLGKRTYLTAFLAPDEALDYDSNTWRVSELKVIPSELCVYIPDDAALYISGVSADEKYAAEKNAQSIQLSVLESARADILGLKKYALTDVYGMENVKVLSANGEELAPSVVSGESYYFAPVESDYKIVAPGEFAVYVNDIRLDDGNSEILSEKLGDFEGVEDMIPYVPVVNTYIVRGLIAEPYIRAESYDGSVPEPVSNENGFIVYELAEDAAFKADVSQRITDAFRAYVNFSGNKNKDFQTNLNNYLKFLVPNSEAARRAKSAGSSLLWVNGRDTTLGSSEIASVIRYGEDMFTAEMKFTIKTAPETDHSVLFLFVRYEDSWRIVRVLNN